jgi:hypothetical protein
MKPNRASPTAVILAAIAFLAAMATLGCDIDAEPGRFTYVVKYEVSSEFAATAPDTINIQYEDDTGTQSPAAFASSQAFEFTMNYDYSSPFDPEMTFNSANFTTVGDKLFIKIIWMDYRTDFAEEVLAAHEIEYTGAIPAAVTIYGPPLPK